MNSPVWAGVFCVALLSDEASVCAPLSSSALFSWFGAPTIALGATRGLGGRLGLGGEGVPLREEVSLGGGGLGAGTGAGVPDETASVMGFGFAVMEGFSRVLLGWGSKPGEDVSGSG